MGSDYSVFKQHLQNMRLVKRAKNHDITAMIELASYYKSIKDNTNFIKYLQMASNEGDLQSTIKLGHYYRSNLNKYHSTTAEKQMEKYYMMAYDKGDEKSIFALIKYFTKTNNIIKLEQYCNQLYQSGNNTGLINLVNYYNTKKDTPNVIKYFEILANDDIKWVGQLILYFKKSDLADKFDQIEKYYKIAYDKGYKNGIIELAKYFKENRINKKDLFFKIANDNDDKETLKKLESLYKDIYLNLKIKDKIEDCMICYEEKQMYYTRCLKHCICYDCMDVLYGKPCPMCRQ